MSINNINDTSTTSTIANTSTTSDENNTLSLNEILEYENELIEDTAAVLGAASDKNCSYPDGYVKRQALYSCLTCIPDVKTDPNKGAGICLACSYHCHEEHELVELYSKRNFRCDCGNSKFNGVKCNLFDEKTEINEFNMYNQNFSGAYCTCHRPYPDPDDSLPDEMIQCILCEDWYHSRHLGIETPPSNFAEMICESCIKKHDFLLNYHGLSLTKIDNSEEKNKIKIDTAEEATETNDGDQSINDEIKIEPKDIKNECKKPPTPQTLKFETKFWSDISWRKELCKCDDCLNLYQQQNILHLIDIEDTVQVYEKKNKEKAKEVVENHNNTFLNSMDRFQLGEVAAGYNDLKQRLAEYLKTFADNEKVVKVEDIKEFFDGMNARKKRKLNIPYHCH